MKNISHFQKNNGFTLIEMLVSLALFTIVSVITVGALLSLIGGNQRLTKQQTLTSSAIFSLDNMTREIRTGNYYNCQNSTFASNQNSIGNVVNDCSSGATGLSFVESSTRTTSGGRIAYYFAQDTSLTGSPGTLWRRIGNNTIAEKLLPDDVVLDTAASRFFVTDTRTLTAGSGLGFDKQPTVTIIMVLAGTAETEPLTLQTTVTQRSLDI